MSFFVVWYCCYSQWKFQLEVLPGNEDFLYLGLVAAGHTSYCNTESICCQARYSLLVRTEFGRSVEVGLACIHISFLILALTTT